jgi:hypothetical protein
VIDESERHCEKHFEPRISTFLGITIDLIDEFENANNSSIFTREFDSNKTDESDLHRAKHDEPSISIVFGISTVGDFEKYRGNL